MLPNVAGGSKKDRRRWVQIEPVSWIRGSSERDLAQLFKFDIIKHSKNLPVHTDVWWLHESSLLVS